MSWSRYSGGGFLFYLFQVCTDAQYTGSACSGFVYRSPVYMNAASTGPVTVTGLDASTGYRVVLEVWVSGKIIKHHVALPAS